MKYPDSISDSVMSMPIGEVGDCNGAGSYKIAPGCRMIRQEFMALFIKRFHHVRRSKKGFVAEVRSCNVVVCGTQYRIKPFLLKLR
jgi:hypothetical protein